MTSLRGVAHEVGLNVPTCCEKNQRYRAEADRETKQFAASECLVRMSMLCEL